MPKIKPKTSGVVIDETLVESPEVETPEVDTPVEEVPTDETPVEEMDIPESVTSDDEITVNKDVAQKAPVKSVRVCPKEDHTCSIGGVRYFFKKGVCQNVPVEVKTILVKAGLLSPL